MKLNNEELLEEVQRQTFRYFWEFAHPVCGLARERNSELYSKVITTGGSGFGLMAMVVAAERKWISRKAFLERIKKVLCFLEKAEKHKGVFPHWTDAHSGKAIPFSKNDTGADLVETSFLFQGLLTVRQYLSEKEIKEKELIDRINLLWRNVNWKFFQRKGSNALYWHWSESKKFSMRLKIQGYNEALITYVLAASSPDFFIDKIVYDQGWARNGDHRNGKEFYGFQLPLGPDYGGPLFFAQYGFLGLDPRDLKDKYADYWQQNLAHYNINYAYCVANPRKHKGYGENCWGLSSCDSGKKYRLHSPLKDNGTICPAAAIAGMPYVPKKSIAALRYFYEELGNELWGKYGFYDGFNLSRKWFADSCLAINQGATIVMIENYRTGLLWNLFMRCDEIKTGLKRLGFQ